MARRPRTPAAKNPLLHSTDAEQVTACLHEIGGSVLDDLHVNLTAALDGSEAHTRLYLRDYKRLTNQLLGAVQATDPDRVVADGAELLIAVHGRPARAYTSLLESCSAQAPFSTWAERYELGDAVALALTSHIREFVGGVRLLAPDTEPPADFDDLTAQRFLRRVHYFLHHDTEPSLARIMRVLALSKSELGRMFGVSRQAIDGWMELAVPADRQEKLAAVLALCDLLERKVKADRVAGVARRPADAYGGLTMLEMIAADRHNELLDSVRNSFAWSQAA
jgi:hypothetical protein